MLSYQHIFHAGNMADVHKHAALAWMLSYLTGKDKPLSYMETHAGRGLYDLTAPEAEKTGEARQGVSAVMARFAPDHPYARAVAAIRAAHGDSAYPGSPAVAQQILRPQDSLTLAELHPREHAALASAMAAPNTRILHRDGFDMVQSLCPPTPRRGLLLVDPSYELREDYARLPQIFAQLHRKWNVGVLVLWYPILLAAPHAPMLEALDQLPAPHLRHEVRFPPARPGHRMVGSGLFVVNPPYGLDKALQQIARSIG